MPVTNANGTQLYYEVRGSGPNLLLIHGTNLDAGCYDVMADVLANDFTVVTYDRRGYSRSPKPADWKSTSIEEQADDASSLLKAIGRTPATVFGSSSAGPIALDMALRHTDDVRGMIAHEPALYTQLQPAFVQEAFAQLTPMIEQAVGSGGPKAGQRALLGALAGRGGFESLASESVRERWLNNAELVFGMEFPSMLLAYYPNEQSIGQLEVPIQVARAAESLPINIAAAEWLAATTKSELAVWPGTHLAYCQRPADVAEAIRPFLRRVSGAPTSAH